MSNKIDRVAVIGAGTMGSGIASHLSNAGIPVLLFDVVGDDPAHRSAIAHQAIERMQRSSPPALMDRDNVRLITACNLEDDLQRLSEVDWIAEAIVERIEIKRDLYRRIDAVRKPGSFVSSNTSTLPLSLLVEGRSDAFKQDFCITHFFNPVRYMRLLELVAGPQTRADVVESLDAFCDRALGKGVVRCRDTPGFLGNRVGVYALQAGLIEARAQGLTVEEADAIMGRPMGIPKTGVFGLYDLIGVDLMLDVVESLKLPLPADDPFYQVAPGIPLVQQLVARGDTGNKSGAGFYRSIRVDGESVRQAVDLDSGQYRTSLRATPEAASIGEREGLRALVEVPDPCGRFAWRVLARTLSYAASLIPEVADAPEPVDEAMKLGYSWSRGPFEMLDELGPAWFAARLREEDMPVPPILDRVGDGTFYRAHDARVEQLHDNGSYRPLPRPPGVVRLGDIKQLSRRVLGNDHASMWDVGEGVACVEFHSKANALSPPSMDVLSQAVEHTPRQFQALLLYNEAPHFSVGFNLEFALDTARREAWEELDRALAAFQRSCVGLREAPFPVVAAPSGLGLGGGYEVLVHCDALQAHSNINLGLVETLVGVVPSGGGCKELLHRHAGNTGDVDAAQAAALAVFDLIGKAKTASSPQEARTLRLMRDVDRVTMNRDRLLAEGRALALSLCDGYTPPAPPRFIALGNEGMQAMEAVLQGLVDQGIALPHDQVVSRALARVLCGGDAPRGQTVSEQAMLDLEREAFADLAHTRGSVQRIEHMLSTGGPLRN